MIVPLVDYLGETGATIAAIALVAVSIALVPLGAHAMARLCMKLTNRGIGK